MSLGQILNLRHGQTSLQKSDKTVRTDADAEIKVINAYAVSPKIMSEDINQNEFTIPDQLKNVAQHESNHFGGKKQKKRPGQDSIYGLEVHCANSTTPLLLDDE